MEEIVESNEFGCVARFVGGFAEGEIRELDMGVDHPGHFVFLFWHDERIMVAYDKKNAEPSEFTFVAKYSEEEWADIVESAMDTAFGRMKESGADDSDQIPLYSMIEKVSGTHLISQVH